MKETMQVCKKKYSKHCPTILYITNILKDPCNKQKHIFSWLIPNSRSILTGSQDDSSLFVHLELCLGTFYIGCIHIYFHTLIPVLCITMYTFFRNLLMLLDNMSYMHFFLSRILSLSTWQPYLDHQYVIIFMTYVPLSLVFMLYIPEHR